MRDFSDHGDESSASKGSTSWKCGTAPYRQGRSQSRGKPSTGSARKRKGFAIFPQWFRIQNMALQDYQTLPVVNQLI